MNAALAITTEQWSAVAAIAAAVAALAAAVSAFQTYIGFKKSALPDLHVSIHRRRHENKLWFAIQNAGPGIAKEINFLTVVAGEFSTGMVGEGFLRGGDGYRIRLPASNLDVQPQIVVLARDRLNRLYCWRGVEPRKRLLLLPLLARTRRAKPAWGYASPHAIQAFQKHFPSTSLEGLTRISFIEEPILPGEKADRPPRD